MSDLTNRLLALLGIFACVISAFLLGSYGGFSFGSYLCDARYPIIGQLGWVSDLDPYISHFNSQRSVTVLLIFFVAVQFIKSQWLTVAIGVPCAVFSLYYMIGTVRYKYVFWDENVQYLRLERELIFYDWALIMLLTLVMGIIMFTTIRYFLKTDNEEQPGV